jgi:excinuclease UvrABC nuclease subunit
MAMTKEEKREYMKIYNATPKAREAQKKYFQTQQGKQTHRQGQKHYLTKIKGVYGCFDGNTNECLYVGGSKSVTARIINHRYAVNHLDKAAKHRPSHIELYTTLSKHDSLVWRVIEECDASLVKTLEKQYIKDLKPTYNIHNND